MRSLEEMGCYNYGQSPEVTSNVSTGFEFPKRSGKHHGSQHRAGLGKPTPSKWDDAHKWLIGLSRGGEKHHSVTQPRDSNADDRRLIAPVPQMENDYLDEEEVKVEENGFSSAKMNYDMLTKKVDCDESVWRINKPPGNSTSAIRSICVRDMGTEMTPVASQEPSRTGTPMRATTPVARSPISSGSSTPARASPNGPTAIESRSSNVAAGRVTGSSRLPVRNEAECGSCNVSDSRTSESTQLSPLEKRAIAWDEAERAKYMARYKREETKIQSWENQENRKAEMEMKRLEVKAERLKSRAQEKLANKLAATTRIAEEKRANAEAKLNEKSVRTLEKADYIRRTANRRKTLLSANIFKDDNDESSEDDEAATSVNSAGTFVENTDVSDVSVMEDDTGFATPITVGQRKAAKVDNESSQNKYTLEKLLESARLEKAKRARELGIPLEDFVPDSQAELIE